MERGYVLALDVPPISNTTSVISFTGIVHIKMWSSISSSAIITILYILEDLLYSELLSITGVSCVASNNLH